MEEECCYNNEVLVWKKSLGNYWTGILCFLQQVFLSFDKKDDVFTCN